MSCGQVDAVGDGRVEEVVYDFSVESGSVELEEAEAGSSILCWRLFELLGTASFCGKLHLPLDVMGELLDFG